MQLQGTWRQCNAELRPILFEYCAPAVLIEAGQEAIQHSNTNVGFPTAANPANFHEVEMLQ